MNLFSSKGLETLRRVLAESTCDQRSSWPDIDWRAVDWNATFDAAQRHRVKGILAYEICNGRVDGAPEDVRHAAKSIRRLNALSAERNARQLGRLKEAAAAAKLQLQEFKGNALADWAYPDRASRDGGDLDLLAPVKQVPDVHAVLRDLGYRSSFGDVLVSGRSNDVLVSATHTMEFAAPADGVTVELHWRWTRNRLLLPFDTGIMYGGKSGDQAVEMFIYLCVHGGLHQWCMLKWLYDIHRLMSVRIESPIDWRAVRARSRTLKVERWIALAVHLSEVVFRTRVPEELRMPRPASLVSKCLGELAASRPSPGALRPGPLSSLTMNRALASSASHFLKIFGHEVVVPTAADIASAVERGWDPRLAYAIRPFGYLARAFRRTGSGT